MKPRFSYRHQYDLESEVAAGDEAKVYNDEPSMTNQQYKDEVDINVMMARMGMKDGSIPPGAFPAELLGTIQDFTDAPDLQEIFARTQAAKELFNMLPAETRKRFGHNPAQLMDFVNDPRNAEEAVTLGLLQKSSPQPAAKEPAAPPPVP